MKRLFFFVAFFLISYTHPALSIQSKSQIPEDKPQVLTKVNPSSPSNQLQASMAKQPSPSAQPDADKPALAHAKDTLEEPEAQPSLATDDTQTQTAEYAQLIELARQGNYAQALDGLSELVELNPENQKMRADYVTILFWADKISEAAEAANGLIIYSAPEYAVNSTTLALWKNGDLRRAQQWATEGIKRFPENEDFPIQLAIILADKKQFEQAEELLLGKTSTAADQALEYVKTLKRSAADEAYAEIIQQARKGDLTTALAQLQQMYQQTPAHNTIAADYLTVLTWDNKMHEAAAIGRSIDATTIPDYALAAGAAAFRKTGNLKEALRWYKVGAKRFPDDQNIRLGLALALAESGQPEKGLALAETLSFPPSEERQLNESKRYIQRMIKAPGPILVPPRGEKTYRPAQDEAVGLARSGKITQSLQTLKALHLADPADQYLLADYMVVLQWSKNNKQLIKLLPKVQPLAFPPYGVAAVATAKTELGDHGGAILFVNQILKEQRRNPDLLIVAAEIYQGAGLFRQSAKLLDEVIAQKVPGMGHAIEATKRKTGYAVVKSMDDLEKSNALLQRSATSQDGMIMHTRGLRGIGGPHEAQKFLQGQVDFSPHNRQAIAIAAENKKSFWAERIGLTTDLKKRNQLLHNSLATLDTHSQVQGYDPSLTDMNRIHPLYLLNENQAAVDIYENLQKKGAPMSTAALLAAGGAYLNLQQPLKAQHLFVTLLGRKDPQNILSADDRYTAMQGLFWAYLEAEQLTKAQQQAHNNLIFCTTPPDEVGRIPKDDWKRGDALNTVGLAALYTGNYNTAEQHFTALINKAPANTQARAGLAEVFSMRNLPRAAYEQTHIARIHEPDNLSFAIDEAQRLMATNQWEEAEELISALSEYAPYSNAVERLMRKWDTHNMHELHMWSSWSETRNSNPNSVANRNVPAFEWRLYSKPLLHNWRIFLGSLWDGGDFEEGTANRTMMLGGVEYRSPSLEANLQLYQDHVRNRRIGVALEGVFQPNDHWKFPFTAAKNSRNIPLRARYNKIYADSASIGIGYYWNESREINMAVGYMDFSDDNQRLTVQADFRQRLTNWDTQYLDMTIETHASHNSKDAERPYFNPKQDYEALTGLVYGDLLWRDYDKSLSHAVKVNGGVYNQKHHNSGAVWNVNYSQTLDLKDRFSTNYGASYGRAYYDGDSENELNLFINMTWKF